MRRVALLSLSASLSGLMVDSGALLSAFNLLCNVDFTEGRISQPLCGKQLKNEDFVAHLDEHCCRRQ